MLLWVELGLTLCALAGSLLLPDLGSRWFGAAERGFGALGRRRRLAVLVVLLAGLAARAAVLPILPAPGPRVDDEFSYLLAADTFAHGRLTSPTPPMWDHFQALHELVRPTYQSKYPPGQGLALALGDVLFGGPFWGVWLSVGLMCAAICWALQAWVGPEWALLGGLIAVMRFGVFSYWADSYWGGAVAAIGGALVLGALPRILKSPRPRHAILMGLGLAVLANSRPYEGLIFSVPFAIVLLAWLARKRGVELRLAMRRAVLPMAVVLLLAAGWTSYYFWRVTGDPLRMPYQVYDASCDPVPAFLGLPLAKVPPVRNPAMRQVYLSYEMSLWRDARSVPGVLLTWAVQGFRQWVFFLGPALSLPLFLAPLAVPQAFSWRRLSPNSRFLAWACALSAAGLGLELYSGPHYAAPMTCLVLAVLLLAMKALRQRRWYGSRSGLFVTRAVPAICLVMLAVRAAAGPLGLPVKPRGYLAWYSGDSSIPAISKVRAEAERLPGRQLVFVRYSTRFFRKYAGLREPHEWAWNSPDIASQKVVWADDLGPVEDRKLIDYFARRRVWILDVDGLSPTLSPYAEAADRSKGLGPGPVDSPARPAQPRRAWRPDGAGAGPGA